MRGGRSVLVVLACAAGCVDLDDPSTVEDLRILGVQVDPSEVILDPARPQDIPATTVSPLVVDPAGGGRPVRFTLVACPNDPFGTPAQVTDAYTSGYPAGGVRASVSSARCPANPELTWAIPPSGEPLAGPVTFTFEPRQLATAFAVDRFPGVCGTVHGGFDLGLPMSLEIRVTAGDETAVALKRVLFWQQRVHPDQRPSALPAIPGVRVFEDRDATTLAPVSPAPLLPDEPRLVPLGRILYVEPAAAEAEPYVTTVVDRFTCETRPLAVPRERLRYTFFASAGAFHPHETSNELPAGFVGRTDRTPLESKYDPPRAADVPVDTATGKRRQDVTIWIVVRDDRGGLSWITRRLVVGD